MNPFRPGAQRNQDDLGEYELSFRFRKEHVEQNPNTLVIDGADSKHVYEVVYRIYSVDKRFAGSTAPSW